MLCAQEDRPPEVAFCSMLYTAGAGRASAQCSVSSRVSLRDLFSRASGLLWVCCSRPIASESGCLLPRPLLSVSSTRTVLSFLAGGSTCSPKTQRGMCAFQLLFYCCRQTPWSVQGDGGDICFRVRVAPPARLGSVAVSPRRGGRNSQEPRLQPQAGTEGAEVVRPLETSKPAPRDAPPT